MNRALILFFSLLATILADTPTVYVGDRYEHRIQAIAADSAGNTYVTGSRSFKYSAQSPSPLPTEKTEVFVAKLDSTNTRLWIRYFSGKEVDYGTAIATDRDANVYVAGYTTSPNFPLLNALQNEPSGAFVLKLSPDGSRLLWSTYYGGRGARVSSIAVAPDGAIILAGNTTVDSFMNSRAFVARIDAAANQLVWDHQFGGTQLACTGGSSCFLSPRHNSASISLDPAGNIIVAGNTNTLDFPTTPGAYLEKGYGPYVRKLSPTGTVLWSTYLTGNRVGITYPVHPADTLSAVAAGSDGSVYITGGGSPKFPTTPGAYRTTYEGAEWPPFGPAGAANPYVAKLNGSGSALVYSTFIGRNGSVPSSIAVDAAGNAIVNGQGDYVLAVNPAGGALLFDRAYAAGSRGTRVAVDSAGAIHAAGNLGVITIMDRTAPNSGLSGIASAAGVSINGRVSPGELISIYGWGLGDEVFVDELAAPVLYRSATQVNAVVPFGVASRDRVTIAVRRSGVDTARAVVAITRANPEIFKLPDGSAAALNEDGTVNSPGNPASAGSLITVYGTGAPDWPPNTQDGSVNPIDRLIYLPVAASAGFQPFTEVTFSGAAPGLVAGVFQTNLRLPRDPNSTLIHLISLNEVSAPAFVHVKP